MTCIVGVIDKESRSVTIAADSLWLMDGQRISYAAEPKVWRDGQCILGFSGSRSYQPFLQRTPFPHSQDVGHDVFEWMKLARSATGKYGLDGEDKTGWTVLIAKGTRLWLVSGSGTICEFTERGFTAVGSGAQYALGALGVIPTRSTEAAVLAVEIACQNDVASGLPVLSLTTLTGRARTA